MKENYFPGDELNDNLLINSVKEMETYLQSTPDKECTLKVHIYVLEFNGMMHLLVIFQCLYFKKYKFFWKNEKDIIQLIEKEMLEY